MSDDERMSVSTFQTESGGDAFSFRSPNISSRGRKRKPVVYDDGIDYSTSPQAKRTRTKAARGGIRGGRAVGDKKRLANIGEGSLFNVVQSGRTFDQVINRWIEEYERNPDAGLMQILQLLIHSCGCRGVLTPQMMSALEYPEIVKVMGEEFDDESSEYPLIQSGQQSKKFRSNFETFLKLLISKCRSGIVFDNKLMDGVCSVLAEMADNSIRAFRHTATFAAMKISTALVDLVVQLVELREKTNLQIDTEKAKLKQKGSNQHLEVLLATKTEIEVKITDVSDMTTFLFKSIFVHRYRDVVPDIRCICITELGIWMKVHPAYFLEDSYLKYVGWLLYDRQAEVRVKCLSTLLPLFEDGEHVARVELFLTKFKDRLVSMVMDRDVDVAIKTCTLLTNVFRYFPKMLDLNNCVPIYEAVYAANRSLAVAAGEFLNTKVFQGSQDYGDDRNKDLIADLLLFYNEGEIHNHATFLVDALIDISPMIKDWATMVNMLLSDECDEFDTKLVDVMTAAIRQAATGESPSGRIGAKKGKDNKQCAEERTKISEVLIPTLPRLLNRHIGDKDKVANLMSIPQFFELHLYPTGRMMRSLEELVTVMERIVEQHSDEEVLKNVAMTFVHFKSNLAVQQHIEAAKAQLLDTLAVDLRTSLLQFSNEGRMDDEDEAEILSRLKKMNAFAA
uniref:SCD domain-containing protein n=1 Tax=Panagrolaimus sp. JU765 TaxID=591449 RepID=A0AC34R336_9BILA